ncbi:MAG: hypothetical protein P8M78_14345 [Myxococcota bacterium]|nr:hypothetical protein [Myxococcota bacterium]
MQGAPPFSDTAHLALDRFVVGLLLGACLWTLILFGFFFPITAFWEARSRARAAGLIPFAKGSSPQTPFDALIGPFVEMRQVLHAASRGVTAEASLTASFVPWISFWSALVLFAIVPVGGAFQFRGGAWSALLADPRWGLLLAFLAPAVGLFGATLHRVLGAGYGIHSPSTEWDRRAPLAWLAMGASLIPILLTYGTLQPLEIGLRQDILFTPADSSFLRGLDPLPEAVQALRLPGWGLVLNPPSGVLFFLSSFFLVGSSSFQGPIRSEGINGISGGVGAMLTLFSSRLWLLAFTSLFVFIYLGGGAIPGLAQIQIVAWVSPYYGSGFAQILCLAVQAATFFVKWVVVLRLWIALASKWSSWSECRIQRLCRRVLLPGALLDTAVTVLLLIRLGSGA